MFWLKQIGVLLVLFLAVVASSGLRKTPGKLWSIYEDGWPRRDALRQAWQTARAGEDVLPARVQAILALLRGSGVESFRYSGGIANDPDLSVALRIAESAYPIRVRPQAQHLLALSNERLEPGCQVVASRQEVVLAYCS